MAALSLMMAREWAEEHVGASVDLDGRACELLSVHGRAIVLRDDGGRICIASVEAVRRQWMKENYRSSAED